MPGNRSKEIHQINYLTSEMDALYHQASVKMGISDSVSIILYTLYDAGGSCLLRDICIATGTSKQTLNSALRGLEAKQLLRLEQHNGRSKRVILTESGAEYCWKAFSGRGGCPWGLAGGGNPTLCPPDGKICKKSAAANRTTLIRSIL